MTPVRFNLEFPCFTILANDCTNPFVLPVEGHHLAMVVFTSPEHLRHYRTSEEEASGPTVQFDSARQLALYLDSLPQAVTHVAINPHGSNSGVIVDAPKIYQEALAQISPKKTKPVHETIDHT